MSVLEVNFDGLIGPSHNYSGLAYGNLASSRNAQLTSNPKQAALQGLEKMRTLIKLGYQQGFLLPQQRPYLPLLRQLGFTGNDRELLAKAANSAPQLLPLIYSASAMWAANAATVTPAQDSADGRVHFTPANLLTSAHRAIEHQQTERCLNTIFADNHHFCVHAALPAISRFADEGAANHTRLADSYEQPGVGLFVFGRDQQTDLSALKFPARQTLEASQAVARQHQLPVEHAIFLQQNPAAINSGAFHNDVVAVGNGPVLFHHELAFEPASQQVAFKQLSAKMVFNPITVSNKQVSLEDTISSYLFNSQLLAMPNGDVLQMRLIAPTECQTNHAVNHYLKTLVEDHNQPIRHVEFVDVRQSMSNGGGPACLRLRVMLTDTQLAAINQHFLLDEAGIDRLQQWVETHYRDRLDPIDLADPQFMDECHQALNALTDLLELGNYYDFQQ